MRIVLDSLISNLLSDVKTSWYMPHAVFHKCISDDIGLFGYLIALVLIKPYVASPPPPRGKFQQAAYLQLQTACTCEAIRWSSMSSVWDYLCVGQSVKIIFSVIGGIPIPATCTPCWIVITVSPVLPTIAVVYIVCDFGRTRIWCEFPLSCDNCDVIGVVSE